MLGDGVINSPARATGKQDGCDHPQLVDGNHRYRAVHARRITDVEHEEMTPGRVVRQTVGALADSDPAEQCLVRAAVEAHPRTATIG